MSALRLSPEAVEELAEAAEWYRTQRPGLEMEFLTEVHRVLPLIETSPASFPRLLDSPADLVVRRALLPRFPYALVFIDLPRQSLTGPAMRSPTGPYLFRPAHYVCYDAIE